MRLGRLDGSTQYFEVDYQAPLDPRAFTVSLWARADGGSGTYRSPLTSRWASSVDGVRAGFNLYASSTDQWQFWTGRTGGWDVITGPAVAPGVWTHVAVVFEPAPGPQVGRDVRGTKRLYVNGTLAVSAPGLYRPNSESPLYLGAGGGSSPAYFFDGAIDQVRLYNTPLGMSSVAALSIDRCQCGLGTGTGPGEICQPAPEPGLPLTLAAAALHLAAIARRNARRPPPPRST